MDSETSEEVTEIDEEETPTSAGKTHQNMLIILFVVLIAAVAGSIRYFILKSVKNK